MNWFQILLFDLSRGRMYRETNKRAWQECKERESRPDFWPPPPIKNA